MNILLDKMYYLEIEGMKFGLKMSLKTSYIVKQLLPQSNFTAIKNNSILNVSNKERTCFWSIQVQKNDYNQIKIQQKGKDSSTCLKDLVIPL